MPEAYVLLAGIAAMTTNIVSGGRPWLGIGASCGRSSGPTSAGS